MKKNIDLGQEIRMRLALSYLEIDIFCDKNLRISTAWSLLLSQICLHAIGAKDTSLTISAYNPGYNENVYDIKCHRCGHHDRAYKFLPKL